MIDRRVLVAVRKVKPDAALRQKDRTDAENVFVRGYKLSASVGRTAGVFRKNAGRMPAHPAKPEVFQLPRMRIFMRLFRIFSTSAVLVLTVLAFSSCAQSLSSSASPVSGERAMEHVLAQVALGPRPPGSPELERCREYIAAQMKSFGYVIEEDVFIADTPYGPIEMKNLIARRSNVKEGKGVIALATHYDTKLMHGINFVGANDAGSSTGLLIELGRVLADDVSGPYDYWFLFFDGEEAFIEWSAFDGTYGSRHLARKWKEDGTASKIRALILLDMIGDKDLDIMYDTNSTKVLMDLVFETAKKEGLESILSRYVGQIEDDHIPFLDIGVPSVDIIDLNYGPGNSWWHTAEDTIDKISVESLEKTGRLVLALLSRLQKESILDHIKSAR